jgi:6-pyruvoyltetrahydropterin/6-carboxytetrahydropterin synthase
MKSSISVARKITFCAGHRLVGHEGHCAHLHGHNYTAYFHAAPMAELDSVGRVIDFSVLKERLGGWIMRHWDHSFVVWERDLEARSALSQIEGQPIYLLDKNPTAENLAHYLLHEVGPRELAGSGVRLVKVTLWETENCFAEATLQDFPSSSSVRE